MCVDMWGMCLQAVGQLLAYTLISYGSTVVLPLCDAADQQLLQRKRQLEMNTLSAAGGGAMATLQVRLPSYSYNIQCPLEHQA